MAKILKALTDTAIRQASMQKEEYTLTDGEGLQLRIRPNGTKSWRYRYKQPHTNKIQTLTLGVYPKVSLKSARLLTVKYNELVALGTDPKDKIKSDEQAHEAIHEHTFKNITAKWFELKKASVTVDYANDIWRSFELHIFPILANVPISQITAPMVIEMLKPIEAKGSLETLKRSVQRINEVMSYAVNHGLLHANPLTAISAVFKKPKKEHMKTLAPHELPELMNAIAHASIKRTTRYLLEFQLHTMVRPSEASGARWEEIDLTNNLWIIPAHRMKAKHEHLI